MAEVVGCVTISHSPISAYTPARDARDPGHRFHDAVERLERSVADLAPDAVVLFGTDHFRGLFYDCMPSFCVGQERVTAAGDFRTPSGDLPTAPGLAADVLDGARRQGFDPALSLHLVVDHGVTQCYAHLFPALDVPLVPVLVNCNAPPLPTVARSWRFGVAVGDAIRRSTFPGRVLLAASGGLSHWPPQMSVFDPELDPDLRTFMIDGRAKIADIEHRRTETVSRLAAEANGRVNEDWDRQFLRSVRTDPAALAELTDAEIEECAGVGGHEVRALVAAFGAWSKPIAWTEYEPVPRWITGMACTASMVPAATEGARV